MSYQLAVKLTVLCSGKDAAGKTFEERTRTTAIERNGGRLVTQQKLQPGDRVQLRLLARPDQTAEIQLDESVLAGPEATEWSFQFTAPAMADFWGIRFPAEDVTVTPESVGASTALFEMTEQLKLLAAHADDHLRYCNQEMELMRQRFARELQAALDSAARQLQQLARSTMQTTFRSLLEDLARRAEQTVDDNLNRLRTQAEEAYGRHKQTLEEGAESRLEIVQERLERHDRQFAARLAEVQAQAQSALQERMQEVLNEFQAGFMDLLRGQLHAAETHKAHRAPSRRK